jgi:hypothetical protein
LERFKLHYDIKKEENMKKKKPGKEQITAKKKCQKVFFKKIIEMKPPLKQTKISIQ